MPTRAGGIQLWATSTELPRDRVWFSSPQPQARRLSHAGAEFAPVSSSSGAADVVIEVDAEQTFQSMLGIGTSLEESTVNNLAKLDDDVRTRVIRTLLDPVDGLGLTLFRLTAGTSDFTAQSFHSYCDTPPRPGEDALAGFSIARDHEDHIVQTVHEVQRLAEELGVAHELAFFASIWSPPGWMKRPTALSRSFPANGLGLKGGRIDDDALPLLARYLTRFVEEYAAVGIPIAALTMQNEPLLEVDYPSALMSPEQQARLAVLLRHELDTSEALRAAAVAPELWAFDHNIVDAPAFLDGMGDEGLNAVDGIALHDYDGELGEMTRLHERYGLPLYLTERSVWGAEGADRIVRYLRNWCRSYTAWVTMLNSHIEPHQFWMLPDTTLFVRERFSSTEFWATPDAFVLGNFARFVRPGDRRIASDYGSPDTVTSVAFLSADGTRVTVVLVNQSASARRVEVRADGALFEVPIAAGDVVTARWTRTRGEEGSP